MPVRSVGVVFGGEGGIFVNSLKLVLLHIKNSESVKVPELLESKKRKENKGREQVEHK